jgi:hypothetical protein
VGYIFGRYPFAGISIHFKSTINIQRLTGDEVRIWRAKER